MFDEFANLIHYGTPRHSGRYPWGSGQDPYQNNSNFAAYVKDLRDKGVSEKEVAEGLGMSIRDLRSQYSAARNAVKQQDILLVQRLRDKGNSTQAISERTGIAESTVRAYLKPGVLDKAMRIENTAKLLKGELKKNPYLDIGVGVEHHIGISRTQLQSAVKMLTDEGYQVHYLGVDQVTVKGNKTRTTVLAPPGTLTKDIYNNYEGVGTIGAHTDDNGRTHLGIKPPLSVDSRRVQVVYAEQGGAEADGTIYVRPGVKDISMGGNSYAQVRIAVDGTHYLKGMAVYKDDLPPGVDLQFNTNKSDTGNKLDAMKPLSDDPDNPFGASIRRQIGDPDKNGGKLTSAMNIVNETGDWDDWNKSLPSQVLSKQKPELAKKQLDELSSKRQSELAEITALTNPSVKKHLLMKFADSTDSDAVDLQAASLPRQATSVILPVRSLKDDQIYAPRFKNGEEVVLIRFPHAGKFEIPKLKVNNRNPEAKAMIPSTAIDAVGINSKVASQLSGADFDGDTVLVIPNERTGVNKIQTEAPLKQLKDFDTQRAYPGYEGMPKLSSDYKQKLMGKVSNLITDMTIRGAPNDELARAVKHSMVVIDAEKHNLNWRQSEIDNGINELKAKYQPKPDGTAGGAATLISRTKSPIEIEDRRLRKASEGGPIDPKTGELVYVPTGKTKFAPAQKEGGRVTEWAEVPKTIKVSKGSYVNDAHQLVSSPHGTVMERVYADHSNRLRAIANTARKEYVATQEVRRSPSAAKTYASEVAQLQADLKVALSNAPLERRAQMVANVVVDAKKKGNPSADRDQIKKWENQAIAEARVRVGAKKTKVPVSDRQWEAIQAGAVSPTVLNQILTHTDLDRIRELATPRATVSVTPALVSRARALVNNGASIAEVAEALGISPGTLSSALRG